MVGDNTINSLAYLIRSIIFIVTVLTIAVLTVPAFRTMIFLSAVKIRVDLIKESAGKKPVVKSTFLRGTENW